MNYSYVIPIGITIDMYFFSSTLNTGICCIMLYSLFFTLYSKIGLSVVSFRYIEVGPNTTTNCKKWKEEPCISDCVVTLVYAAGNLRTKYCFVGDSRNLLRDHLATIIMIIYTRLPINVVRERNHPSRCNPGVIILMYQMQV